MKLVRVFVFMCCLIQLTPVFNTKIFAGNLIDAADKSSDTCWIKQEIIDGFDYRLKILGFGILRKPKDTTLNYDNQLSVRRYEGRIDLRPDFNLNIKRLELAVKPRAEFVWKKWEDGDRDGEEEYDSDFFVNEWLARFMVSEELFVSYGRENLQWGPSYMFSPSNPFLRDNGRDSPDKEVTGLDFGKVIWIPNNKWSVSIIANTDEGRLDSIYDFKKKYALKIDYTGNKKFATIIPNSDEFGEFEFGFFGGLNLTEALLLYCEGNIADTDDVDILAGCSYTLETGSIFSIEYYHHEKGCTDKPIHICYLRSRRTGGINDILQRQNYLMAQFVDTRIYDSINIIARFLINLDDDSNRSSATVEYEISDNFKFFTNGMYFDGNDDSEFGCIQQYSIIAGVEFNL